MRQMLPVLLKRLGKIPDPRDPKKLKHRITVLMIYGILVFAFQYSSRREANREITRPMFEHNLRLLFPQLDSLPHSGTLFRLLCRIDVHAIEQAHIALLNQLIRNKKFTRYLINNCYPIGIDGTQKIAFSDLWDEHLLQRRIGPKVDPDSDQEQRYQYYVYVLESRLCFRNGMVIPLMSEFLQYEAGGGEQRKQDCESKAFHRLAARIKKAFPRLPILLLLDGLYPNGPIMQRCRSYHWDFSATRGRTCIYQGTRRSGVLPPVPYRAVRWGQPRGAERPGHCSLRLISGQPNREGMLRLPASWRSGAGVEGHGQLR
jgi:hypothetical protein